MLNQKAKKKTLWLTQPRATDHIGDHKALIRREYFNSYLNKRVTTFEVVGGREPQP